MLNLCNLLVRLQNLHLSIDYNNVELAEMSEALKAQNKNLEDLVYKLNKEVSYCQTHHQLVKDPNGNKFSGLPGDAPTPAWMVCRCNTTNKKCVIIPLEFVKTLHNKAKRSLQFQLSKVFAGGKFPVISEVS